MRSGHFNHQRHAQQQAQFFARVEAERRATRRDVVTDGPIDETPEDREWVRRDYDRLTNELRERDTR